MGGKASPDLQFGLQHDKVLLVPFLIRIIEDEVERAFHLSDQIMGIAQTCIDNLGEACLPEKGSPHAAVHMPGIA